MSGVVTPVSLQDITDMTYHFGVTLLSDRAQIAKHKARHPSRQLLHLASLRRRRCLLVDRIGLPCKIDVGPH